MFSRSYLIRGLSLSVGSFGSYSNHSICVDDKSSGISNGMKHINSFFKTATDGSKKYHAITDDAKFA